MGQHQHLPEQPPASPARGVTWRTRPTPYVASDPQPAVLLREQLATARAAGVSFEDVWPDALAAAVKGLTGGEMGGRGVLVGLRSVWEQAFERRPATGTIRLAWVLDVSPGD